MTWDIFCSVIDNYGDIGVTWRLARQLADEHALPVRLWVDDLAAFQHIRPEIDPARATQHLAGVEIRRWVSPLPEAEPGEVVIEALACNLPDEFISRMAAKPAPPVWLNLEYLSAEDWVVGVHGLPSPHPRLALSKHFFMPGYSANTGGLTRERWLTATRDAFQADADARATFFASLGLPAQPAGELRLSLFSYKNRALPSLLQAWATDSRPVCVLVPVSKALPDIAAWLATPPAEGNGPAHDFQGETDLAAGTTWQRGALTLHVLPMLDQDAYDRLLWACDLNFVRGEDSCVRAQFAARPLVWQAYRQNENAHLAKLDALLDRYCADLDTRLAEQTRALWHAWNQETDHASDMAACWAQLRNALPELTRHARAWDTRLAEQTDLATNLLNFCRKWLK